MKWRLGLSGADDNNTCLIRPEWGADDDDGHHMVGAQEFVKKYGKFNSRTILITATTSANWSIAHKSCFFEID